ncbi:hypothetical protein HWV62_30675 [Athelia sp. TMB]|nr:hypothetical protein HWV62_30675 [Athelia sp. TMB]
MVAFLASSSTAMAKFALSIAAVAALAAMANAQSLNVVNKCSEDVFLFTQTSFGTIATDVTVAAGASTNMGISSNWDGAISTGTGCSSDGSTCTTVDACSGGALPAGGGGCVNNAGPGPNSPFYYNTCYNAYAFPDNDGVAGYSPADNVDYTCGNADITLTLCPGTTSDIPNLKRKRSVKFTY